MPVLVAASHAPGHAWPVPGISPECPARVDAALTGAAAAGAAAPGPSTWPPASRAEIEAVHDGAYIEWLERASADAAASGRPTKAADSDDEVEFTYLTASTATDAALAAGACLHITRCVLSSPTPLLGLALVRPPGHHAARGRPAAPSGFCYINNVAVATAAAMRAGGVGRVAILDIDVHVGDGTASTFAADPAVLVLDVHEAGIWPGGGGVGETGEGEGVGATINVPLPRGAGDAAAAAVAARVIGPALARFKPELVIVSLGLDAHAADPLGGLAWTGAAYRALGAAAAAAARATAGGKLVAVLEGGYSAEGIADGVAGFVRGAESEEGASSPPHPPLPPDAEAAIAAVIAEHGL
jgi:acetoin utilization deacetylase AcuC-like enzyme